MSIARVHNFSISLDGFATGEGQTPRRRQLFRPRRRTTTSPMEVRHPVVARDGRQDRRQRLTWSKPAAQQFAPGIGARDLHAGCGKFGWPGCTRTPNEGRVGTQPAVPHTDLHPHPSPAPSIEMEGGTTFRFIDASPAEALRPPARLRTARTYASAEAPP